MESLKGKRRILWLGGLFALVFGVLAAAIVLPQLKPTPAPGAPEVQVPNMQNVPPEQAPKLKLEVEQK